LNLEVQNIGEVEATDINAILFGPEWVTTPSTKNIGRLSPSEPEMDIEGELRSTKWRLTTPMDIKTETMYSVGTRVAYKYSTVYTGTLRVVKDTYLETLPEEEKKSLLESGGVVSASATGGPLSVNPVKGRSFIVEGGGTRPIKFKLTNVGNGYTYTGDIATGNYQVIISSENLVDCGKDVQIESTNGKKTIKLSKGESRMFICWFVIPSDVINKQDVLFSITFDYNYYVDDIASITVEPLGEEIPIITTTTTSTTTTIISCSGSGGDCKWPDLCVDDGGSCIGQLDCSLGECCCVIGGTTTTTSSSTTTTTTKEWGDSCEDYEYPYFCCWRELPPKPIWDIDDDCIDDITHEVYDGPIAATECETYDDPSCDDYCISLKFVNGGIIRDPWDACCCS